MGEAHGLVTTVMDRVDNALLDSAPRLKVVSQMAVGVDNVDVAELTRRGIPLGYTPDVLSGATADLAFALLLAAARRVVETDRWVRAGNWKLAFHPTYWLGADVGRRDPGNRGLGQDRAGGGSAGPRLRDEAPLLLPHPQKWLKRPSWVSNTQTWPTLLRRSDFVSLHVPLTPETRHLIRESELSLMKPTAILISTARGPVVDSKALYAALKEGRIGAAALDVTDPEPIPADDPLLTLDNLVVTPHIGSASVGSRKAMAMLAARNLLAGLKGERLVRCYNPEVYGGG